MFKATIKALNNLGQVTASEGYQTKSEAMAFVWLADGLSAWQNKVSALSDNKAWHKLVLTIEQVP